MDDDKDIGYELEVKDEDIYKRAINTARNRVFKRAVRDNGNIHAESDDFVATYEVKRGDGVLFGTWEKQLELDEVLEKLDQGTNIIDTQEYCETLNDKLNTWLQKTISALIRKGKIKLTEN